MFLIVINIEGKTYSQKIVLFLIYWYNFFPKFTPYSIC